MEGLMAARPALVGRLRQSYLIFVTFVLLIVFLYNGDTMVYVIYNVVSGVDKTFVISKPVSSRFLQEVGNITRLNNSRPDPLCIEVNICRKHPQDEYYVYQRMPDFMDKVNNLSISAHSEDLVPNIFHFIQFTDRLSLTRSSINDFHFHHMVSVLSAYRIHKPEKIYFWMDREPTSLYWLQLKSMVPMYLIKRERPTTIRGKNIHFVTKVSNVIRMEVILEYGGMYVDLDVIVVKPLDHFRKFNTTMGKEHPTKLCNAVIIGKPWSFFLQKWHQTYASHNELNWSYHSGTVPYLLYTQFPSSIHVEEPTSFFKPGFQELTDLFSEGQLYDWRSKNFCVHLWIRLWSGEKPTDYQIDTWNTTVGELYRYILYGDARIRMRHLS